MLPTLAAISKTAMEVGGRPAEGPIMMKVQGGNPPEGGLTLTEGCMRLTGLLLMVAPSTVRLVMGELNRWLITRVTIALAIITGVTKLTVTIIIRPTVITKAMANLTTVLAVPAATQTPAHITIKLLFISLNR